VPKSAPEHIAIVGGGFSAVMTAVNLVRLSKRPLHLTVINCRRPTEFLAGEVLDIEPEGERAIIHLTDSTPVEAERVVLAMGNEPPAALPGSKALAGHPASMGDPWQPLEQRLPGQGESIVALGTGTHHRGCDHFTACAWLGG
jgi:uncharacterized NAD(P)/FAD-binding protein YdhS